MAVPASPVDDEVRAPARNHPEQIVVESCTISRWCGYVSSTFVALLEDGTPVAESGAFRCRGSAAPPDEGQARRAYDELRAELNRLGWEDADARREVWYAGRFNRVVAVRAAIGPAATTPVFEAQPVFEPDRSPLREAPTPPPAPARLESPLAPEPQPVKAMPVLPSGPHTAEEAPRRSRAVTVVSVLGIVVAVAVASYLVFGQGSRPVARAQSAPASAAKPKDAAPASAASVPARPLPHRNVRVTISANGRRSWLEVRRGSATGPVLFTGELAPGRTLHLAGTQLWGRFGAAGNLTITSNGRPVKLLGTYEHVFVAPKP